MVTEILALARAGEPFAVEVTDGLRAQFVLTPVDVQERTFKLAGTLTDASGKTLHPVLIGHLGAHMGISGDMRDASNAPGSYDIKLVVTEVARPAPPAAR